MRNLLFILLLSSLEITSVIASTNSDSIFFKTYGGTKYENNGHIKETKDHGFILGGSTNSFGNADNDYYLLRLDSNGDTIFTKNYIKTGTGEVLNSIIVTNDGGYCLAGHTVVVNSNYQYDMYMLKTDSMGKLEWTGTYGIPGTSYWEEGYNAIQTQKGDYVISGYRGSDTAGSGILYKVNSDGYSPSYVYNSDYRKAFKVIETEDSCLISVGNKYPEGIHITKNNKTGGMDWSKIYTAGLAGGNPYGFCKAANNGYMIASDGGNKIYFLRINDQGDTLWTKKYTFNNLSIWVKDMIMTRDSNYIITGPVYSSATVKYSGFLMGINSDGDSLFFKTYGQSARFSSLSVIQCADDNIVFSGHISTTPTGYLTDLFVYKVDYNKLLNSIPTDNKSILSDKNIKISLSPNPVKDELTLLNVPEDCEITIYNMLGSIQMKITNNQYKINTSVLPQGVYIIKIYNKKEGVIFNEKFIKK